MKSSLLAAVFTASLLLALPAVADAPTGHYEPFVRDTNVIRDRKAKLAWQRGLAPEGVTQTKRSFASAESGCGVAYGGRVPTVKELLTLVDEAPHFEYEFGGNVEKAIDGSNRGGAFGSYTNVDAPYWSSTPTGETDQVWGVDFSDGTMVSLRKTDTAYARCVK